MYILMHIPMRKCIWDVHLFVVWICYAVHREHVGCDLQNEKELRYREIGTEPLSREGEST